MGKIIFADIDSLEDLEVLQSTITKFIQNKKFSIIGRGNRVSPVLAHPQDNFETEVVGYDFEQKPLKNNYLDSRLVEEIQLKGVPETDTLSSISLTNSSLETVATTKPKRQKKIPLPPKPEVESKLSIKSVTDRAVALLNKGTLTLPDMHQLVIQTGVENMGLLKDNPEALQRFNKLLLEREDVA